MAQKDHFHKTFSIYCTEKTVTSINYKLSSDTWWSKGSLGSGISWWSCWLQLGCKILDQKMWSPADHFVSIGTQKRSIPGVWWISLHFSI